MKERSTILAPDFARNLKRLREREGLSQAQLAMRASVTGSMVCMLERGKEIPSLLMVERLAQAMGIEPREMFRRRKT